MDFLDSFSGDVKEGGQTITYLHSVDDIDLTCSNEEDLQQLTSLLDITQRNYGMEIHAEKSKILIVGKERRTLAQTLQIMATDLETAVSFKYLGTKITADGKCSEDVRSRLAMATSSLMNFNSISQNSNISIKSKYRLLTTIWM